VIFSEKTDESKTELVMHFLLSDSDLVGHGLCAAEGKRFSEKGIFGLSKCCNSSI
jgi:hypothetical protein